MGLGTITIPEVAISFAERHPSEILQFALENYEGGIAISFSGAEDVVLVDMAAKIGGKFSVFSLDTGRLHPETYQLIDKVREYYGIPIETYFPQASAVENLVKAKGLYSFYKDGHKECCGVRKVEPLRRALKPLDAWVTGQRHDQSPSTRTKVAVVEVDPVFSSPDHELIKFNPLANWTSRQVWNYIRENDVPYNSLHEQGFISIGCEPCTRRVLPGQHEREGRWWWEDQTKKECGLHSGNVER